MPITDSEGEQLGSMELNDPESIDFVNQFKEARITYPGVKKFENNDFQVQFLISANQLPFCLREMHFKTVGKAFRGDYQVQSLIFQAQ